MMRDPTLSALIEDEAEQLDDKDLKKNPTNRSVFNLIYDNDDDNEDSIESDSYLEREDLPLPVVSSSGSSKWSRFGQCCDCCDACLRNQKWRARCACGTCWKNISYYLLLNGLLCIFFYFVMYLTLINYHRSLETPPYKQTKFRDKNYPGLSMEPSMVNMPKLPISIISYGDSRNPTNPYVESISSMVYNYSKACNFSNNCDSSSVSKWGPCQESDYGYASKQPCIFLKLNKLMLWLPEEYMETSDIPPDIPEDLRSAIELKSPRIWVHCQGHTAYDQEKIGDISYYPGPYFEQSFFPVSSQKYTNPIITMQLTSIKRGYIVKVVCGMYAKNVNAPYAHHTYVLIQD